MCDRHSEPRGSRQRVGGQDHGDKGFGLALMVEALTMGLSGHGRAAARSIAAAARHGLTLDAATRAALVPWARRFGVVTPFEG